MFLFSLKLNAKAVTAAAVVGALCLIALCFFMLRLSNPATVVIGEKELSLVVEDEKDARSFVEALGKKAEKLCDSREITVPTVINEVYENYIQLQHQQKLHPEKFKGEKAVEYTYLLSDEEYAVALVSGGRIIAAHLTSMKDEDKIRPLYSIKGER